MRCSLLVFGLAACLAACGGGGGGGGSEPPDDARVPLLLAAGAERLEPAEPGAWAAEVDLDRLGIGRVNAHYDLTTPADTPFAFDLFSRGAGNSGPVRIAVAHALDGGVMPTGGPEAFAAAGVLMSAAGATTEGRWLSANGDGFARLGVSGKIVRPQVIAVEVETPEGGETALIRVAIGPGSGINPPPGSMTDYPGVLDEQTIYSSDSWLFGLPTVAVSGDRTSVVCYEGDRGDPRRHQRYEMRLQHDGDTGEVTGGGSESTGEDSGHWRDHEIAALFNVLALVRCGGDGVAMKLSFDRGATFAQEDRLDTGLGGYRARLAQIAIAADYTLAVLFWRTTDGGVTELALVEGRPEAWSGGSPVAFTYDPVEVVHRTSGDVTPLLMSAAWSDGGDLAVGYGFSSFTTTANGTWTSRTQNRCAVRLFGGTFRDVLVEEDLIVGRDPSVSLVGHGAAMRVLYAYESSGGATLAVSEDAGATFREAYRLDDPSAHTPTVLARAQDGKTRVDLLFLAQGEAGAELGLVHWDDFDAGGASEHRLTRALFVPSGTLPPGTHVPGAEHFAPVPDTGFRVTQVAWFGYDAVLDGDDVVVVYDEETFDSFIMFMGAPEMDDMAFSGGEAAAAPDPGFVPAEPPPLAPGMTETLPAPDPDHMHQLRLLRLD